VKTTRCAFCPKPADFEPESWQDCVREGSVCLPMKIIDEVLAEEKIKVLQKDSDKIYKGSK